MPTARAGFDRWSRQAETEDGSQAYPLADLIGEPLIDGNDLLPVPRRQHAEPAHLR